MPDTLIKEQLPTKEEIAQALAYNDKYLKLDTYFPARGKYARSKYKKQLVHFEAGLKFRQRMFMAANRVGKTEAGAVEVTYHLTGLYPDWWKGKRFTQANHWWLCGKDTTTVREIFQPKLLGGVGDFGTGIIPKHSLNFGSMTTAKKAETLVTSYQVLHEPTGEYSTVTIKTYESGRTAFEGTTRNIWLDEEPPEDIYNECLARITDTGGGDAPIMIVTFTPLKNWSKVVGEFTDGENQNTVDGPREGSKWFTNATIYDVPHLSDEERKSIEGRYKGHDRQARINGLPTMGTGPVYPFDEKEIFIAPFQIPSHFKRVMALDFGKGPNDPTAMLYGAIDPNSGIVYIYHEYAEFMKPISIHASCIQAMDRVTGFPVPKCCDPSGGGQNANENKTTRALYARDHQIYFISSQNALEAGIMVVFELFTENRLKIFKTCLKTKQEFTGYHRNEKGQLKGSDHLMDCLRYIVLTGRNVSKSKDEFITETYNAGRDYSSMVHPLANHPDGWLYGY